MLRKKYKDHVRRNTYKCNRLVLPFKQKSGAKSMHSKWRIRGGSITVPSLEFRILPTMHHAIRTELTRINNYVATNIMPILQTITEFANTKNVNSQSNTIATVAKYATNIGSKIKELNYNSGFVVPTLQLPIIARAIIDRSKFHVGSADIVFIYAEAIYKLQAEYSLLTQIRKTILSPPNTNSFLDNTIQSLRDLILAIRKYQTVDTFDLTSNKKISKREFENRILEGAMRATELPILILKTQIALFSAKILIMHPMASILVSTFESQIRIIIPSMFF